MFVDRVTVEIQAGRGGDGCCSFRRERYLPRGGPNGGNGGKGGSVIIVAESGVNNLSGISHKKHWKAQNGKPGQGSNCHGRGADDITLRVPPGTIIIDAKHNFVLKDLTEDGDSVNAARGGKGGKGNTHFKSATNRAPRETTPGEEGEHRKIVLELKSIADVGLIGKPNAGKSTLLSRLTRARPEIASYPFTTKHPNLGRVQVDMDRSFVMADIPGLIEGAHEGIGLGHEFLKHIQRSGVLIHLIEPDPMDGTDPMGNYRGIRDELAQYDEGLGQRPEIVCITKAELPTASEVHEKFVAELETPPLLISAVTGQGLNQLTTAVGQLLDMNAAV